ncbi:MAG: peptidyl-prolyl cis-trans isomerase [Polyangiaceae bacterium]
MPPLRPNSFAVFLVTLLAVAGEPAHAADAGTEDAARRAKVVLTVGKRPVTAGEIEDRLASLNPAQRAAFGADDGTRVKRFVDDVLVPELLLAEGANAKGLASKEPYSQAIARSRANATLRFLRKEIGTAATIPAEDVKRYYDANRGSFDAPERIAVWRILVKTKDEAEAVLADVKKEPTPERWRAIARDKSLDKATNLRGGNLGFLTAEGDSSEPGLRVIPEIVKAAASVRDGELVARPVPEGEHFAVVWRRGTLAAAKQGMSDADAHIRDTLYKKKMDESEKAITQSLRATRLSDLNEALVNTIDIALPDGGVVPRKRPGQVPPLAPPR